MNSEWKSPILQPADSINNWTPQHPIHIHSRNTFAVTLCNLASIMWFVIESIESVTWGFRARGIQMSAHMNRLLLQPGLNGLDAPRSSRGLLIALKATNTQGSMTTQALGKNTFSLGLFSVSVIKPIKRKLFMILNG